MNIPITNLNDTIRYSSDKYLINESDKLIIGQLLDEQLIHMCEHANFTTQNEFGTYLPRLTLLKKLKMSPKQSYPDCKICQNLGITDIEKDPNQFTYKNIGGKLLVDIVLNEEKSGYNMLDIQKPLFDVQTSEIVPIQLKTVFTDIYKKPVQPKPEAKIITAHEKGQQNIKHADNPIDKLGKISTISDETKSMDIIVSLFAFPIEKFYILELLVPDPKKLKRHLLVTKILLYRKKILEGTITRTTLFKKCLSACFPSKYKETKYYDLVTIYKDIFFVLGEPVTGPTLLEEFTIDPKNPENLTSIGNLKEIPPELVKNSQKTENIEENIFINISGSLLEFIHTNLDHKIRTKNDTLYCSTCGQKIERSIYKKHLLFHKKNEVSLQSLLKYQVETDNDEERLVTRSEVYDAKLITFCMTRKEKRRDPHHKLATFSYDTDLIPEKTIKDRNGNEYFLIAIVTENNDEPKLFTILFDTWIVYVSDFNVNIDSDYITKIGSYDKLMEFDDEYVKRNGVLYCYQRI